MNKDILTPSQAWIIWQSRILGYACFILCDGFYLGFPIYMLIVKHELVHWGFWVWGISTSLCTWWQLWVQKQAKKILKREGWL